jgi:hypothetical protein
MSFATLKKSFGHDKDLPARAHHISALRRVLNGTQYDELKQEFHEEKNGSGEYIPLRKRRPSVRYPLCRLLVDDSVSLLFSGDHLPAVDCEDEATQQALARIAKDCALSQTLITAATIGSVGSVALFVRVLESVIYVDALSTEYLTPTFSPTAPDKLIKVTEKRKVRGKDLADIGYPIDADHLNVMHWFQRDFDDQAETWFVPWMVAEEQVIYRGRNAEPAKPHVPKIDAARSVDHGLGFVPIVWIRNLPGGDQIDGLPTFTAETIDVQIEIEYLLSQGGRGLKYSADPLLLIKEPAGDDDGAIMRDASNALIVGEKGDAKLVEIGGTAAQTIIEWARFLRELALEGAHGNRASAEKLSAAQSGKAMELMNQALIWLVDRLRVSYGEVGLLNLYRMIVQISNTIPLLNRDGSKIAPMDASKPLSLRWPDWYAPTSKDRMDMATTLRILVDAGIMSRETAVKAIASVYDIENLEAEMLLIKAELAERNAAIQPAGVQEKIKISE